MAAGSGKGAGRQGSGAAFGQVGAGIGNKETNASDRNRLHSCSRSTPHRRQKAIMPAMIGCRSAPECQRLAGGAVLVRHIGAKGDPLGGRKVDSLGQGRGWGGASRGYCVGV